MAARAPGTSAALSARMTSRGAEKTRRGPSSRMTSMGGLCLPRGRGSTPEAMDNRGLFPSPYRALKSGSNTPSLFYRPPIMGTGQPLKGGLDVNRQTIFASPYLLGFDHLERLLERTARTAGDSYPPYNIEELEDNGIRITLAVAGFSAEELSVTEEDRQLGVRGRQAEANGKTFLHRGIAARQFLRSFVLADGIEVTAAALANGLLKIDLARKQVQTSVRVIDIRTGGLP